MPELFAAYQSSLWGLLALAALIFIQFGVADVALIRAKHVPGMPVTEGHGSFLFRAVRAHANTSDNLGLFLLVVLVCVLAGASAEWTRNGIWLFVAARAGHMACYYADLRLMRSVAFGVGAVAQLGLFTAALLAV